MFIRDFFNDSRDGFFLDVGAANYKTGSNTYYLEKQLGWSGIAIDGMKEYEKDYLSFRPQTRFFNFYIAEKSNCLSDFYVAENNVYTSTGNKSFIDFKKKKLALKKLEIPTITLNDLLTLEDIENIDLLSMDIEMSEPPALQGFDIERYKPLLVVIEAHPQVRQQIEQYFAKHRYIKIEKYSKIDPLNLYYTFKGAGRKVRPRNNTVKAR